MVFLPKGFLQEEMASWFYNEAERQEIPPDSTLCIDGDEFLDWISRTDFGIEFGGNFQAINDEVERIIEMFQRCGFKLIFFFDGVRIDFKLDEQGRNEQRNERWNNLRSLLTNNISVSSRIRSGLPLSRIVKFQLISTLESMGVRVIKCQFEADQDIGRYATEKSDHYCIASRFDFYFKKRITYVPFSSIQFEDTTDDGIAMTGLVCSTSELAQHFQLSEDEMIEWAILLGNDYTKGCVFKDYTPRDSSPHPIEVLNFLNSRSERPFIAISKHPEKKFQDAIRFSRLSYQCQDPRDPSISPPLELPILDSSSLKSTFSLSLEEESQCHSYLQSKECGGSGSGSGSAGLSQSIPRLGLMFLLSLDQIFASRSLLPPPPSLPLPPPPSLPLPPLLQLPPPPPLPLPSNLKNKSVQPSSSSSSSSSSTTTTTTTTFSSIVHSPIGSSPQSRPFSASQNSTSIVSPLTSLAISEKSIGNNRHVNESVVEWMRKGGAGRGGGRDVGGWGGRGESGRGRGVEESFERGKKWGWGGGGGGWRDGRNGDGGEPSWMEARGGGRGGGGRRRDGRGLEWWGRGRGRGQGSGDGGSWRRGNGEGGGSVAVVEEGSRRSRGGGGELAVGVVGERESGWVVEEGCGGSVVVGEGTSGGGGGGGGGLEVGREESVLGEGGNEEGGGSGAVVEEESGGRGGGIGGVSVGGLAVGGRERESGWGGGEGTVVEEGNRGSRGRGDGVEEGTSGGGGGLTVGRGEGVVRERESGWGGGGGTVSEEGSRGGDGDSGLTGAHSFDDFSPKALLALALMQWKVTERHTTSLPDPSPEPSLLSQSRTYLSRPDWDALWLGMRYQFLCLTLDQGWQMINNSLVPSSSTSSFLHSRLTFDPKDWFDGYDLHHALKMISEFFSESDIRGMSREDVTDLVLHPEKLSQLMGLKS